MPTRRFAWIAPAQLLVGGCAVVFGACVLIEQSASTAGICASPHAAAAARFKSVQTLYGASTELPADHAYNTKHNTFVTKHRSKW